MPHRKDEVSLELEGPWADHSFFEKSSSSSSESVSAVKVGFIFLFYFACMHVRCVCMRVWRVHVHVCVEYGNQKSTLTLDPQVPATFKKNCYILVSFVCV